MALQMMNSHGNPASGLRPVTEPTSSASPGATVAATHPWHLKAAGPAAELAPPERATHVGGGQLRHDATKLGMLSHLTATSLLSTTLSNDGSRRLVTTCFEGKDSGHMTGAHLVSAQHPRAALSIMRRLFAVLLSGFLLFGFAPMAMPMWLA